MAPLIKPDDLKTTLFNVGGFRGANVSLGFSNAPQDSNGNYYASSDKEKHFIQGFKPLSFDLRSEGVTKLLDFGPPKATENIVYLPYFDDNITSTVIPTQDASVSYFITKEMSGCNFFLDELPNGDLVCYHANALGSSPTKDEVEKNAAAFHPDAPTKMDAQHRTALTLPAYQGARPVATLRVADYYAKAKEEVDARKKQGSKDVKDVKFYGGTTIMGFRVDGKWQFWFQTYGRFPYTKPGRLFQKDKEFKVGDVQLELIDARCFWSE